MNSNMGDAEVSAESLSAKKPKNDDGAETKEVAECRTSPENTVKSDSEANGNNAITKMDDAEIPGAKDKEVDGVKESPPSHEPESTDTDDNEEKIELKIAFNKTIFPVIIGVNKTIGHLKAILESHTQVSPALQKVVIKGIPSDDTKISSLRLANGAKVLVIGTKLDDVLKVNKPVTSDLADKEEAARKADQSSWSTLTQHRKIIDKGVPDDAMPGILNDVEPLPNFPLYGMLSSKGSKLRLTFKLASDELWIGTKERTDKIPISSVRSVVSQPITGIEHYHILALQLGPTEASRVYIYWVPAQYIEAIKSALGV